MSLILGLIGTPGSGKGTVAKLLHEHYGAHVFRFSAILSAILERLALPPTREQLIKLSETLRQAFGEDILSYALAKEAVTSSAPLIVLDGIRRIEDLAALEPLPQFKLIEVTAPTELRYQRLIQRGEKHGETSMSWEQFLAEERASTEVTIPEVAKRAQHVLDNHGTPEYLKHQLDVLLRELDYSTLSTP